MNTKPLEYQHVDVFTSRPYGGNSLTVFPNGRGLTSAQMLAVTLEMRHFESIFLEPTEDARTVKARVFDLIEELDFAGHPIIGAASALHERMGGSSAETWSFVLKHATVTVITKRTAHGYGALLNQGRPEFLGKLPRDRHAEFAAALNLDLSHMSVNYVPEVISTGLRYLVFPIESGLGQAHILHRDFGALLATVNAQFVYVLDVNALEGRHWNNDGIIEDVATGSGAGTVGAYVVKHGRVSANQEFILHQGRFTGRPSQIRVCGEGSTNDIVNVRVGGDVVKVGHGVLDVLPEVAS